MRDPRTILTGAVLALAILVGAPASARSEAPLQVAAAPCPPFVINDAGRIGGLAIFLWDRVARLMDVEYEITEYPLHEMLTAVATQPEVRRADVGISCLTISAEREMSMDFSHSFHQTHLAIAVKERGTFEAVRTFLANPVVLKGLAFVLGAAVVVGAIFFLLERNINPKLFSMQSRAGKLLEALIVGLLFVTRGPIRFYEFKTLTGRTFSALLAIGSTLLIAGITAVLASAFTIEGLQSQVTGLHDLRRVRVGALHASTSATFLERNGITHRTYPDLEKLLVELDQGRLGAVVADADFLKYAIKKRAEAGANESLAVLPYEFQQQNYGIALLEEGGLQEAVNRALLQVIVTPEWKEEVLRYLGE